MRNEVIKRELDMLKDQMRELVNGAYDRGFNAGHRSASERLKIALKSNPHLVLHMVDGHLTWTIMDAPPQPATHPTEYKSPIGQPRNMDGSEFKS